MGVSQQPERTNVQVHYHREHVTDRKLCLVIEPGEEVLADQHLAALATRLPHHAQGPIEMVRTDHQV